jgi:Fe-S cluster assembly protein SufD
MILFVNGQLDSQLPQTFAVDQRADGLTFRIPDNTSVALHLLFNNTGAAYRHHLVVGKNSRVTVLEEHQSTDHHAYATQIVTHMEVEADAEVQYYKIQNESLRATHESHLEITQHQNSVVKTHTFSIGALSATEKLHFNLQGTGAACYASGLYFTHQNDQQIGNYIQIDHQADHGISEMHYKGMADKKSRAQFGGKIYVREQAQKTKAQQTNHNLLLCADAEVRAKPELEIYADDVKCAHGNTVGQLDAESLFYLRSRGIEERDAIQLLTRAFAEDVINRVSDSMIRERMSNLLLRHCHPEPSPG